MQLEVGVVVVGGATSPLLWEHCLSSGIVVLSGVAKRQMEGVCHLTKATPLSYLADCLEVCMCTVYIHSMSCLL